MFIKKLNAFCIYNKGFNMKKKLVSIATLATLISANVIAAPLNLYNKDGKLLSDSDYQRLEQKNKEAFLINPKLAKFANSKYFSISLQTFSGLNSFSPEMIDITKSYLGLVIGNKNYNEFLNDFEEASSQNTVIQFTARFSLIPLILSGQVKSKAIEEINHKADLVGQQYLAAAAGKIHEQVQGLVAAGKLPADQAEITEAKFIGSAKLQIDAQVNLVKSQAISKTEQKISKIQEEATFQEFAIRFGHKLFQNENGALLVFGEVGKAGIEGNLTGTSGFNSTSPMAWWAPKGMSIQGTGEVKIGLEWMTQSNIKVGFETYFFHNRSPVISGQRFITNLIYTSDADFQNQKEFWKIDSNMEKFYVKVPSKFAKVDDQLYISTADSNGKRSVAAGGLVRILPKLSIQVDSNFNHANFDYAISEIATFHASKKLSFYLVNENIKGLQSTYDQDKSGKKAKLSTAGVGITYRLVDLLLVGVKTSVDVNAECRYFYEKENSSIGADVGCGGGVMLNAKY